MVGESVTSQNSGAAEPRAAIIEAAKSPLGLAALAVLVIDGLLTVLALRASGVDFSRLVIGILSLAFVLAAIIAYFIVQYSRERQRDSNLAQQVTLKPSQLTTDAVAISSELPSDTAGELHRLRSELHAYTALRGPMLAILSPKKSVQLDTILTKLGVRDDSRRMQVLSVLGKMIDEGIVRHSATPGWYVLSERR